MLSSRSLLPPVICIIAQYWSFSCNNASYKKSEIIFYFHVSSRFSLNICSSNLELGLFFYHKKKAIADEEKGEAGTWANFSKAASRLGKSVWSPQSDSSWWWWKFAAASYSTLRLGKSWLNESSSRVVSFPNMDVFFF